MCDDLSSNGLFLGSVSGWFLPKSPVIFLLSYYSRTVNYRIIFSLYLSVEAICWVNLSTVLRSFSTSALFSSAYFWLVSIPFSSDIIIELRVDDLERIWEIYSSFRINFWFRVLQWIWRSSYLNISMLRDSSLVIRLCFYLLKTTISIVFWLSWESFCAIIKLILSVFVPNREF